MGCQYVFYVEGGIQALYVLLKANKKTDLLKDNTFYEEEDLKVHLYFILIYQKLYKIENDKK